MSYSLLIQKDRPMGYWSLSNNLDIIGSNNATIINGNYTKLPLVINSSSSLIVRSAENNGTTPGSSVVIFNSYDIFYKNFENTSAYFELWFSFNGGFDGSGYSKNLSSASQYFVNNKLKILKIMNNTTEIGSLNYDYSKNTFRFSINGINNTDAYIVPDSLNNSFYIIAGYNNRSLSINVNGNDGVGGYVKDTNSYFPDRNTSSIYFAIDSTTLNTSASKSFVIGNLALYRFPIDNSKKNQRMVWAFNNDKPAFLSNVLGTSFFDLYENPLHVGSNEYISGKDFKTNIDTFNTSINYNDGITANSVNNISLYYTDYINPASVSFSASGVSIKNVGSLFMSDFGKIFSGYKSITINSQIYFTGNSSADYIFSLYDNNTSNYIVSTIEKTGFYVKYYNAQNNSFSNLLYLNTTVNSGSYNFAFSHNSGSFYLYATASNGTGSITSTSSAQITINKSDVLEIANKISITSASVNSLFKNFGITYTSYNDFSNFNFTENKMIMARFTNDLSVSRVATWTKLIPLSVYGQDIIGSKITWDSMDNCLVQISYDGGGNWNNVTRGAPLNSLNYGYAINDALLKITVPYEYAIESNYQSFSDLQIILYKDLSFFSRDNQYYMYSNADGSGSVSYTIQRMPSVINLRKSNFGITFDKVNGWPNGYSTIVSSSYNSPMNLYAMDFWVKYTSLVNSASQYIIDSEPGGANPSLFLGQNTNALLQYSTGSVYVNGQYVTSNSFSLKSDDYYHIFYDFGNIYTGSAIYIGGKTNDFVNITHSHMSFGFLNLWPYLTNSSIISSRYNSYVSNNIVTVSISDSTSKSIWQPNWNNNYIDAASGYKLGRRS